MEWLKILGTYRTINLMSFAKRSFGTFGGLIIAFNQKCNKIYAKFDVLTSLASFSPVPSQPITSQPIPLSQKSLAFKAFNQLKANSKDQHRKARFSIHSIHSFVASRASG